MQDRFAGDIGEFAKYGLLHAIKADRCLGVAWYLTPDSGSPGDGRFVEFLCRRDGWRCLDACVFDALKNILMCVGERSVTQVQKSRLLDDADCADERLDIESIPVRCRRNWRGRWFDRVKEALARCDLVLADPDNGLVHDQKFRVTRKPSVKSMPLCEVNALAERRTAVITTRAARAGAARKSGTG